MNLRTLLFATLIALSFAACKSAQQHTSNLPAKSDIKVPPVKNLSGVTLHVPEFYIGDAVGSASNVEQDKLDLALLTRAALIAGLRQHGHTAEMTSGDFEAHAAITMFNSKSLRSEGWFEMGVTVIFVDADGAEIARGEAESKYQLFTEGPDELGTLGDQRFVAARIKAFTETLTTQALSYAGVE
ncbi:MAG: hypothetical protein ACYTDT_00355 [Planctomycetota bacterium]|jgi:hypothetical protein